MKTITPIPFTPPTGAEIDFIDRARRDLDALMALSAEALAPSRSTVAEVAERVRLFEADMRRGSRLVRVE